MVSVKNIWFKACHVMYSHSTPKCPMLAREQVSACICIQAEAVICVSTSLSQGMCQAAGPVMGFAPMPDRISSHLFSLQYFRSSHARESSVLDSNIFAI